MNGKVNSNIKLVKKTEKDNNENLGSINKKEEDIKWWQPSFESDLKDDNIDYDYWNPDDHDHHTNPEC